jgi:hypothetical protein
MDTIEARDLVTPTKDILYSAFGKMFKKTDFQNEVKVLRVETTGELLLEGLTYFLFHPEDFKIVKKFPAEIKQAEINELQMKIIKHAEAIIENQQAIIKAAKSLIK